MNRFVIALLLTLICTSTYADKPQFQILMYWNDKPVGSAVPDDRRQTVQSAAHHMFHDMYTHKVPFQFGDKFEFKVVYGDYEDYWLYGCFEKVGQFRVVKRPGDCK